MELIPLIIFFAIGIIAGIQALREEFATEYKPQRNQRVTGQPRKATQPRDRRGRYATLAKSHQKHQVRINHMNGTTEIIHI